MKKQLKKILEIKESANANTHIEEPKQVEEIKQVPKQEQQIVQALYLSVDVINTVCRYLATKPFGEVHELIATIHKNIDLLNKKQ